MAYICPNCGGDWISVRSATLAQRLDCFEVFDPQDADFDEGLTEGFPIDDDDDIDEEAEEENER